jgi:uncharacterized protein YqhQ
MGTQLDKPASFFYGGQAVIEGVMMRGLNQATVAVRNPGGELVFKHEALNSTKRHHWERLPLLRGILALWDTLNLGIRSLSFSAQAALGETERPISKRETALSLGLSLLFAFGVFFFLPLLLASQLVHLGATPFVRDAVEGVIQLVLLIGYLWLVGRLDDMQRVFGYHGAEHKTINAYEAGAPLTVASVRGFTTIHPRCGTSFLLVVMVISIPLFALFSQFSFEIRLLSRIILIPVTAAIAFELLRLTANHFHRAWVRFIVAPSLALQRLTTREPDDHMLEVAIAALVPVLQADGRCAPSESSSLSLGETIST